MNQQRSTATNLPKARKIVSRKGSSAIKTSKTTRWYGQLCWPLTSASLRLCVGAPVSISTAALPIAMHPHRKAWSRRDGLHHSLCVS